MIIWVCVVDVKIIQNFMKKKKKEKKMKNSMYYFLLGFMAMFVLVMFTLSSNPEQETETICGKCGSQEWWFQIAEGE